MAERPNGSPEVACCSRKENFNFNGYGYSQVMSMDELKEELLGALREWVNAITLLDVAKERFFELLTMLDERTATILMVRLQQPR